MLDDITEAEKVLMTDEKLSQRVNAEPTALMRQELKLAKEEIKLHKVFYTHY